MNQSPLILALCELNPDDLITELARSCGAPAWVFSLRERMSALKPETSEATLKAWLSESWAQLSEGDQALAAQSTAPLSLSAEAWRLTLSAEERSQAHLDELAELSLRYLQRLGAPLPLNSFKGLSARVVRRALAQRLERDLGEERRALGVELVERAWLELKGLPLREELERR